MPALARVIENTRHDDGTIESKVRVTASLEQRARGQAIRAALRHNGYSDVLLSDTISVENIEVEREGRLGMTETYIIDVTVTEARELLQK